MKRSCRWWSVFDLANKEDAISVMEREAAEPGYWDDHQSAQMKMQQLGRLKSISSNHLSHQRYIVYLEHWLHS